MPQIQHTVEQIIIKLLEVEVALRKWQVVVQLSRTVGITEQTHLCWCHEYNGLKVEQAKCLKELNVRPAA